MNLTVKYNHFQNKKQPTIMCSSRESIATMLSKYVLKKRNIKLVINLNNNIEHIKLNTFPIFVYI